MVDIGLLQTFGRELLRRRMQARGAPPSTALDETLIRTALREGGSSDGRFAAGYAFHTAHMAVTIFGAENCLDLGAAPGCQLLPLAKLLPQTTFIGIDKSTSLLADAQNQTANLGLSNVSWREDDICRLNTIADDSIDAVVSTMTLHDLPTLEHVNQCLASVARVLRPGGAVYIEDYGRLKSPKSVAYFNAVNETSAADAFTYLNASSLHAAFTIAELKQAFSRHLPQARVYSTYLIPFLNVAKTPDRDVPAPLLNELRELRTRLSEKKRADLDDLRKFFRLGGWRGDPF